MKKIKLILAAVMCLSLLTAGIVYAVSPLEQAKVAAHEEFSRGWKSFSAETWDGLGFTSFEQAQSAYIGETPIVLN